MDCPSKALPGQRDMFGTKATPSTAPPELTPAIMRAALAKLRGHVSAQVDEGTTCPCCNQYVKRYKRALNSTMARWLIWLVRTSKDTPGGWVDIKRCPVRGGDYAKLMHWGMVTQAQADDGANRSGMWRPTEQGIQFAYSALRVPSHVFLLTGEVDGWATTTTDIREALGKRFDYLELMGLVP